MYFSPNYLIHIVDRVGGGDSFGGTLIYALYSGDDCQKVINFAIASSCLKHSIEHDYSLVSVSETTSLASGMPPAECRDDYYLKCNYMIKITANDVKNNVFRGQTI